MEHHPSSHPSEHSPDNERAAQLEKDRQYLLFLLANDLGYDTRDVSISSGSSNTEASVNPAHYMITIPPRQECQQPGRTVAIYPDITLVFDTHATQQCRPEQHGLLESCTKEELLALIKQDAACGLELPHGQRFTASMVDALTHPIADARARITEAKEMEQQHHTARTRRSLGKVTIHRAAGELRVAPLTVEKALDDPVIRKKLGKIATTQRGTELQHLLTPRQVATLAEHHQRDIARLTALPRSLALAAIQCGVSLMSLTVLAPISTARSTTRLLGYHTATTRPPTSERSRTGHAKKGSLLLRRRGICSARLLPSGSM